MAVYTITKTASQLYVDDSNVVIQGYRVFYTNEEYHEKDFVDVPNRDETVVKTAIMKEVEFRRKLAQLGK
jgi:hypothetical protein